MKKIAIIGCGVTNDVINMLNKKYNDSVEVIIFNDIKDLDISKFDDAYESYSPHVISILPKIAQHYSYIPREKDIKKTYKRSSKNHYQ